MLMKDIKNFAHNQALPILDMLMNDLQMNYSDIRFFSQILGKEIRDRKNYILVKSGKWKKAQKDLEKKQIKLGVRIAPTNNIKEPPIPQPTDIEE